METRTERRRPQRTPEATAMGLLALMLLLALMPLAIMAAPTTLMVALTKLATMVLALMVMRQARKLMTMVRVMNRTLERRGKAKAKKPPHSEPMASR